jgi:urea carboxylase
MFNKVLIANRAAISCRISRTLAKMGIGSVSVHSEADRDSLHVDAADESFCIGPGPAAQSYLDVEKILSVARTTGAQAIHPGYGFLSENAAFARTCEEAGIVFLGPSPEQMLTFGLKHTARATAKECGVPLLPGTDLLPGPDEALEAAAIIGYPVMLKSTAGGGGIGMRRCYTADELSQAWESVQALAEANFKDSGLYLEKFVSEARHVEVQIFGDGMGKVVALAERDCSIQRRNQKVIEETPAPGLSEATRTALREAALTLGRFVNYRSAGTVEFVLDADTQEFWFLEVNTRLQVEHGVSEEVHGVDLVEWMVRLGAGDSGFLDTFRQTPIGHAMQARVYAEDPARGFAPCAGRLTEVSFPSDARIETWVSTGCEVPPWYDPMLAKVIVHAPDRAAAIAALDAALSRTRLSGISQNVGYLRAILQNDRFCQGRVATNLLADLAWNPRSLEVVEGGAQTTLQDWPGRQGLWDVGIPPSGPMDAQSFRLGNLALGNPEGTVGLEFVLKGPSLRAHSDTVAILTGADFGATLDGVPLAPWVPFDWTEGAVLKLTRTFSGARGYLLVQGGFDVPEHLGSRSTFTLGQFGGHGGRALRTGDQLLLQAATNPTRSEVPESLRPELTRHWELGVLLGPHAAPDYFLPEDIDELFGKPYTVHHNSDRTGVRLVGPKPRWARTDGGEAGLHPSNLHDNAYVVGTVDFTGDTPVILGPDGPSLGGFACPVTLALSELWKLGQLACGDTVRFVPLAWESAREAQKHQEARIQQFIHGRLLSPPAALHVASSWQAISHEIRLYEATGRLGLPDLCIRQDGDDAVLVEFGPMVLDIELRLRAHLLLEALHRAGLSGILDMTPGIRSLQVRFDPLVLGREVLLKQLITLESSLADVADIEIPNRVVHLPISWDDPATRVAIEKYMATVNPNAPWCPSNIEFIRRINGLESIQEVQDILFQAEYLVMGLGDVYLGAPVATPLDPRHRLVTTKYNPARTWTPENAVGIGGAYLCVYGMEGPGGYQFVGRTVQMWNRWKTTPAFEKPWLLRFFDILRFYPVSQEELAQMREDFPRGRWSPRIESSTFSLRTYRQFLSDHSGQIEGFRTTQRAAFQQERGRWADLPALPATETVTTETSLPTGCEPVISETPGSLWKLVVKEGDKVEEGQVVAIMETMKMESPIATPFAGIVKTILVTPGAALTPGQVLMGIEP